MTTNYPTPVNQFNRIYLTAGSEPTGTYAAGSRWNNLHNGRNYDSANCTAAMGAVLIDADSGGTIKSTPARIRNAQNDWSGGIGWDDVNVALASLYNRRMTIPIAASWYDVLGYLKQGRFVGIQGDYDQVPYAYQYQKGGTFDHAFGLGGYRSSDGRVLRYDPLGRGAVWVPQSAIRAAAEKLAMAQRGTRSRLFVAYSRVMTVASPPTKPWWGSDVPADIRAAYTATAVATKLRSLGLPGYGDAINLSDLEAGLRKRGIDFGTSVQLIDVRALMRPGTGN